MCRPSLFRCNSNPNKMPRPCRPDSQTHCPLLDLIILSSNTQRVAALQTSAAHKLDGPVELTVVSAALSGRESQWETRKEDLKPNQRSTVLKPIRVLTSLSTPTTQINNKFEPTRTINKNSIPNITTHRGRARVSL